MLCQSLIQVLVNLTQKLKIKNKTSCFVETAEALKVSINSVYLEIDELKSKKNKNNIHLAELKTKLDQIAKKNKEVTNEKELKALQLEEEIAKKVSFANEEIERFDKLTVAKEEKLKELQEKKNGRRRY